MSEYDELVRRIRRRQASMRDSGEIPLSRRNDADLAADAIEALEARVAQADEDALDRVREINELELKVAALERERDEARAEVERRNGWLEAARGRMAELERAAYGTGSRS